MGRRYRIDAIPDKLTYVGGDTYFLVTNAGQIQKSTDNGASWTTVFIPGNELWPELHLTIHERNSRRK